MILYEIIVVVTQLQKTVAQETKTETERTTYAAPMTIFPSMASKFRSSAK